MRRAIAVLTAAALAALPAACTSSKAKGSGPKSSTSSAQSSSLAGKLQSAVGGITSAQVAIEASLLGEKISGSGPAMFSSGTLAGFDVQGTVPGVGKLRLVLAAGKVYAQLPPSLNTSGKPWLAVTPTSTNTIVGQLSSILTEIQAAASLTNLVTLVNAAAVSDKGSDAIGEHFSLVVDAAKLPAAFPGKSDLASGPLKGKPIDIWIDSSGRPVKLSRPVLVSGSTVPVSLTLGDFNKPVMIAAPPASDVGTV